MAKWRELLWKFILCAYLIATTITSTNSSSGIFLHFLISLSAAAPRRAFVDSWVRDMTENNEVISYILKELKFKKDVKNKYNIRSEYNKNRNSYIDRSAFLLSLKIWKKQSQVTENLSEYKLIRSHRYSLMQRLRAGDRDEGGWDKPASDAVLLLSSCCAVACKNTFNKIKSAAQEELSRRTRKSLWLWKIFLKPR